MSAAKKKPITYNNDASNNYQLKIMSNIVNQNKKEETIRKRKATIKKLLKPFVNKTSETIQKVELKEELIETKLDFKFTDEVEKTLNFYLEKLETFIVKLDDDKKEDVNTKAKMLEAVLNTDMLKIN